VFGSHILRRPSARTWRFVARGPDEWRAQHDNDGVSTTSTLRIDRARFLVITAAPDERAAIGPVFQATDGRRFVFAWL
jgi:hypothetical protein